MRERLTNLIERNYSNVRVWEYYEQNATCYLRFTTGNDVYIASILKAGSHVTIFKGEGSLLL